LVESIAIVGFTWGMAHSIAFAIAGESVSDSLTIAGYSILIRAVARFTGDVLAHRVGYRIKQQLRDKAVDVMSVTVDSLDHSAHRTMVVTQGLDAVDDYAGKFLPSVLATIATTPLVVAAIYWADVTSGIAVTVTLPLIPLFMVLIGWATHATQLQQWQALSELSVGFSETVRGLPTLLVFGRGERQIARVAHFTREYRDRTMQVLRLSFVSGFALEIAASLSVAIVAVTIGLRLVAGEMELSQGLWALMLAPEAFLAVRQVGTLFHASADGAKALTEVFDMLENNVQVQRISDSRTAGVVSLRGFEVNGRTHALDRDLHPASFVSVAGISGAGKSSLIAALLGLTPYSGRIEIDGVKISDLRDCAAWSPQNPSLLAGTVQSNVTLGAPVIDQTALHRALELAAVDDLGLDDVIGENSAGISGGQAQRVSLARAFYRHLTTGAWCVIVDEPTAGLDPIRADRVMESLDEIVSEGALVIVAHHRETRSTRAADRIVLT
jgi:ATP-binding cassette subfamily C protein CydD